MKENELLEAIRRAQKLADEAWALRTHVGNLRIDEWTKDNPDWNLVKRLQVIGQKVDSRHFRRVNTLLALHEQHLAASIGENS